MKRIISITLAVLLLAVTGTRGAFAEKAAKMTKADDYTRGLDIEVVDRIELPKGYHEGLYHEDGKIWVCNGEDGDIWVVDPAKKEVVSSIEPVGTFTEAVTRHEGEYWLSDWNAKKIYRVTVDDGVMTAREGISTEPAHPAGILWVNDTLFVITWTRGMGTRYHLMELTDDRNLKVRTRIRRIHEPAHMAWDGSHLWITSWYNRYVYKLDIEKNIILASFKSPAPRTTGIARDGEHFWITGTSADLYKVKLPEDGRDGP
jgi:glutamine cyclotransferase